MSRHEDDLDGWEDLDPRQQAAVTRFQGRAGRYQRDRIELTNRQQWADFWQASDQEERRRYGR